MENNKARDEKKLPYSAPRLMVHGTVESITLQTLKNFGFNDGISVGTPSQPVGVS